MPVTDQFYGGRAMGTGRTVQDFGLCDLKGEYFYTAKARMKGLLVVVFFDPQTPLSQRALDEVQRWTAEIPTQKWTAIGVTDSERGPMTAFVQERGLTGLTMLLDYELYQTRNWGVSNLPSVYLVSGKTGRTLQRILGSDPPELAAMKTLLSNEVAKMVAAEEAAKKAEEEKKAADAAAKAAAEAAKPAEPAKA